MLGRGSERTGGEVTGSLVGSFSKDPRGMYLPENSQNIRTTRVQCCLRKMF